jgi:hypothetical protein
MTTKYPEALRLLQEAGYVKAEVGFEGGDDEGGVTDITVIKSDGTTDTLPSYMPATIGRYTKDKGYHEVPNPDHDPTIGPLIVELGRPVHDRYHTFAGEFFVQGTVTFDVEAGKVFMNGYEETRDANPIDQEF